MNGNVPSDQRDALPLGDRKLTALYSNCCRIRPQKPKRGYWCTGDGRILRPGDRVESRPICQTQIVSGGETHGSPDIQRGIRPKDDPGGIHQEQIGSAEAGRLEGAENVGRIAACYTAEDVGGREAAVIEKIGDVVGRNAEVSEAMKQIGSRSRSGGDVILQGVS
ncbi:MAG TPA: hypothetical protein PLT27_13620 [Nitrospira sp.]|nr:hypothetical protein [Nitrospira sp.]